MRIDIRALKAVNWDVSYFLVRGFLSGEYFTAHQTRGNKSDVILTRDFIRACSESVLAFQWEDTSVFGGNVWYTGGGVCLTNRA